MRFSVIMDDIKSLLDGTNQFIKDVNDNKIECLQPNGILKIIQIYKNYH